jgi:hypothetical protein
VDFRLTLLRYGHLGFAWGRLPALRISQQEKNSTMNTWQQAQKGEAWLRNYAAPLDTLPLFVRRMRQMKLKTSQ